MQDEQYSHGHGCSPHIETTVAIFAALQAVGIEPWRAGALGALLMMCLGCCYDMMARK